VALGADPALNAHFDVFPFDYGPTPLDFLLPGWSRAGSREDIADRLQQPSVQQRILTELNPRFVATLEAGIAETMYFASDGADGELIGKSLGEVAREWKLGVAEASIKALVNAGVNIADCVINERWADMDDLTDSVADETFFIMGDGVTSALDGPLDHYGFSLADWGYAPEMLGRMVRQLGVTTLESAIARMTEGPARQLGLEDRGVIRAGLKADLVIFDPETVGTNISPDRLIVYPSGIEHVLVNGTFAVAEGHLTNSVSGVVGLA
jgi:N-acyl-D-amino-acid deacylase